MSLFFLVLLVALAAARLYVVVEARTAWKKWNSRVYNDLPSFGYMLYQLNKWDPDDWDNRNLS